MRLLDRLAHARALERAEPAAQVEARPARVSFERRERSFSLASRACVGRGGELGVLTLPSAEELARDLVLLGAAEGERAVILDTETTGLDGAAVPFVVGLAWVEGGQLVVGQWTLGRLGGEAELLAAVLAKLEALAARPLISFNGASFDLPLLRLRAHRHGLSARALERPHLDLLHVARRLQRGRSDDCRLATLERDLLGLRRRGDIPSAEIPEVFWTWLRAPDQAQARRRLDAVHDHNLLDCASLPALLHRLAALLRAPEDADRALRAARHLRRVGAEAQGRALLAAFVGSGARASWVEPSLREAAFELARLERRAGARARAAQLWRALWLDDPGCPRASEAWAKHLEHHAGELEAALVVARGSRQPCTHRIARLERRLARQRVAAEPPERSLAPQTAEPPSVPRQPPGPAQDRTRRPDPTPDRLGPRTVRYRLYR